MLMSSYEAGPEYNAFYNSPYIYAPQPHQQHQQVYPPLPSPPHSPKYAWRVTTVDEDAHRHQLQAPDPRPSPKGGRRSQVPAETMSSLMAGPDPLDGKYVCLYGGCMRRFGRKYNIQSHIQTHLSDRPFRCTVCGAGFVRRHDLLRHARIHGPSKDFVCGCGKGFSRMDALNRHRQRQICKGAMTKEEMAQARLEIAPPRRATTGVKKKTTGSKSGTSSESGSEEVDCSSNASSQGSASPELRPYATLKHGEHADSSTRESVLSLQHTPPLLLQGGRNNRQHPFDRAPTARYLQEPLTPTREHSINHPYLLARSASHQGFAPQSYVSTDQWINPQLISPTSQMHRAASHNGGLTSDIGTAYL